MPGVVHSATRRSALAARYDAIWNAAAPEVREGRATLDAWAMRKVEDERRGVTLLARPSPAVAGAFAALLAELYALESSQYYQPLADLHLTVLAPFSASLDHAPALAHLAAYDAAVAEALDGATPFAVDFVGVTLSSGAVLAQGFPRDGTLERVRERLRTTLVARGLGDALDTRYRLETAHTTLVRFTEPLRNPARFVDALQGVRERAFGTSVVRELELVVSDWYQSAERSRRVAAYTLPHSPSTPERG